eukprot:4610737-Pleurochrysis_carterae.AAC.4
MRTWTTSKPCQIWTSSSHHVVASPNTLSNIAILLRKSLTRLICFCSQARTASASTSRRSLAPWQHEAARPLSAAVPTAVSEAAKFNAMGAANGETEHAHGAQETAAEPARACS